jgi:single-strand DNA-binding protein
MMGNLTRDPEYKQLQSGQAVCRLGIASNRQFKNKQSGAMVQEVCFIDVDVWGQQAESCNQFLQKGRSVLVEGRLKLDSWQDNDGNKRSKHSIVADRVTFLAGATTQQETDDQEMADETNTKSEFSGATTEAKPAKKASAKKSATPNLGEVELKDNAPFEDDLPF